jgi:hypothetical protein
VDCWGMGFVVLVFGSVGGSFGVGGTVYVEDFGWWVGGTTFVPFICFGVGGRVWGGWGWKWGWGCLDGQFGD